MNKSSAFVSAIALAAAALTAGHAVAADPSAPKTREQVRAELAEAQRTGNFVVDGETGLLARQMFPGQYPQTAVAQGAERDEAVASRERAVRSN